MSPEMHTRTIGSSTIEASVVGLGTWAIGGWMWGGTDEADSVAAIRASLDEGVSLIDTAPAYGQGSRGGDRRHGDQRAPRRGGAGDEVRPRLAHAAGQPLLRLRRADRCIGTSAGSRSSTRSSRACGASARTTSISTSRTGRIRRRPIEETMEALVMLRDQGKIRSIGASNVSADDLRAYAATGALDAIQEEYSMVSRDIETTLLPIAAEHRHLDAELLLAGARPARRARWDRSGRSPATTSARTTPASRSPTGRRWPASWRRSHPSPKRTGPRRRRW